MELIRALQMIKLLEVLKSKDQPAIKLTELNFAKI